MATSGRSAKIQSIQLLRFLAAFIVAYSHIAFGFAAHIADQRGLPFAAPSIELSRVALFFVISGTVMVIASGRLYEVEGGWKTFMQRRIVRILPLYWAASLAFAAWKLFMGEDFRWSEVFLSLVLIPYSSGSAAGHPVPFLWPAWTLFYEVIFYVVLAAALSLPRVQAVLLASGLLLALVVAGQFIDPDSPFVFMATRPVLLLFVPGMVLGLMLARNVTLAPWGRLLALFAAAAFIVWLPEFSTGKGAAPLGWWNTFGIAVPALLVSLAVMAGPLPLLFPPLVERLGDMSYAIFLLHVPIVSFWIWFYQEAMPEPGPWGFLLSCLAITFLASYCSYRFFERPLTDWLNQLFARPAPDDAKLQRTGV